MPNNLICRGLGWAGPLIGQYYYVFPMGKESVCL